MKLLDGIRVLAWQEEAGIRFERTTDPSTVKGFFARIVIVTAAPTGTDRGTITPNPVALMS